MVSVSAQAKGFRRTIALLLLATLLGSSMAAANPRAQPETIAYDIKPVTDPVAVGTWLRQLVGKYRFEGMVQIVYTPPSSATPLYPCVREGVPTDYCQSVKGKGDCVAVGTGPGVQCILNVEWRDIYEIVNSSSLDEPAGVFNLPGGVSYMNPSMSLFGLDPAKATINHLLVDNKGLPEGGMGSVAGNRATFKTPCVNVPILFNAMKPPPRDREEGPPRTCERIIRIDAKPDAALINMSVEISINDVIWTRQDLTLRREAAAR
jgi:hypothetical protein